MLALLLTPFLGIVGLGLWSSDIELWSNGLFHLSAHSLQPASLVRTPNGSLVTALLFVVWNYMGWDNASTIAAEVENPQRNYIRSMMATVLLVAVSYVLPIAVVALAGIPSSLFVTGSWVAVARMLAAPHFGPRFASWLAYIVVAGGALTGIAMFNALMLSYARVPAAMAGDGLLPKALARRMKNGVPWVAVLVCAGAWAFALELNLTRLLELDILLYGLSLVLEFVALAVLRWREPSLPRPFRVPGGRWGAVAIGIAPTALVFFTIFAARADRLTPRLPAILFGAILAAAGPLFYLCTLRGKQSANSTSG
jgi:amino acid transporter